MICEYCRTEIAPKREFGMVTEEGIVLLAETHPAIDREVVLHAFICLPSWLLRHPVWVKFVRTEPPI